jgi:hypothetical protein
MTHNFSSSLKRTFPLLSSFNLHLPAIRINIPKYIKPITIGHGQTPPADRPDFTILTGLGALTISFGQGAMIDFMEGLPVQIANQ